MSPDKNSQRKAFDYERAAHEVGWRRIGVSLNRWRGPDDGHDPAALYEGTARELCYYLGMSPEFEEHNEETYKAPEPSDDKIGNDAIWLCFWILSACFAVAATVFMLYSAGTAFTARLISQP